MSHNETSREVNVAETLDRARRNASRSRWLRWTFFVLLVVGGVGSWQYYRAGEAATGPQYVTETTNRGDLLITVSATGTLEPVKTVDVGIEVSGTINTVEVDYNERVVVGQVLARLDTSILEAQTLQTEAALRVAQAKLVQVRASVEEARAQLARMDGLRQASGGKLPSETDYDAQNATLRRARADESSAKASVDQAQANLDVDRSNLTKAVIHSPIDGVVLERSVEPGQTVAAQLQTPVLFTLAEDLTQMELQIDVDEADVGRVQEGQQATFTVDAYPDRAFPANTTQVRYASETVEGVVTYKTILHVDNADLTLRPGMTATAELTVDRRENAILISNAALRFSPPETPDAQASGGSLLSRILPHPPARQQVPRVDASANAREQQVWILNDGQLAAVSILKGVSDGVFTEVISGDLDVGMAVVTDTAGSVS